MFDRWLDKRLDECVDGWMNGRVAVVMWMNKYLIDGWFYRVIYLRVGKGKAVPLQAWITPEGSRKLGFPDLMTTAQDGGKVVSLTHRPPLSPGNAPGTHFC